VDCPMRRREAPSDSHSSGRSYEGERGRRGRMEEEGEGEVSSIIHADQIGYRKKEKAINIVVVVKN